MIVKQIVTLVAVDEDSGREVARVVTKAQGVYKESRNLEQLPLGVLKRAKEGLLSALEGLFPAS